MILWVFPQMVVPPFHTPKSIIFSRKTRGFVGETQHFRKPPYGVKRVANSKPFDPGSWFFFSHQLLQLCFCQTITKICVESFRDKQAGLKGAVLDKRKDGSYRCILIISKISPTYPCKIPQMFHQQFMKDHRKVGKLRHFPGAFLEFPWVTANYSPEDQHGTFSWRFGSDNFPF